MSAGGRPRRETRPHEDLARAVVRVLSQARQNVGLSRRALADRSGVSVNTIIKIERAATTDPGFTVVARLAQGLGLNLDNLIGRAQDMTGDTAETNRASPQRRGRGFPSERRQ